MSKIFSIVISIKDFALDIFLYNKYIKIDVSFIKFGQDSFVYVFIKVFNFYHEIFQDVFLLCPTRSEEAAVKPQS